MIKSALAAGAAIVAAAATPAAAQVNGMATADTAVAIARTQALQTGFQQISASFEPQRQAYEQRQQQYAQLIRAIDTNGDGQLSEAEASAAPEATVQQLQGMERELAQIQAPVQRARVYVVSQIAQQYGPAVQQVATERGIQMVIAPEALIYAPDNADVTDAITTALNARVPTVSTQVPEGWQPSQGVVQIFQQIQQLLLYSAMQQQQQQGQAAPAQPQPQGR